MVQTLTATDKPRISFNKLCEYPHVPPAARRRIAREQKYPADYQVSFYQGALYGLLGAINLATGDFDPQLMAEKAEQIAARSPEGKHQKSRQKNNVQALHQLTKLATEIHLPPGEHVKVTQKALMEREGVTISVRPEFITYDKQLNTFALTKFRFSNSPVSADAAETGLALLLEFAKEPRFSGHLLDLEHTMIIDVFSGSVIRGHTVGRHRLAELDAALRELATIWPDIKPPGQRQRPSPNGPGG
jgi:hypothetical protein